ncbi:ankyrin repeat-containing domain protein [Cladochytrium replicatum]|nr:ankyrin repeat-containing domain protein [Cladochytrium replicatum]
MENVELDEMDSEKVPLNIHQETAAEEPLDIFHASKRGFLDRVAELLDSGVDPNGRDNETCTALHWAAWNNHLAIVKFLVDRGAEIDVFGGDLWSTPLHWAVRAGHVHVVTFLVKKGANVEAKDNQGYNALHLCCHGGHPMVMAFLIASGMDVDTLDSMSRTPLMWCAYKGISLECVKMLLRAKADIDRADLTGFTALHWAVASGHLDFAKTLLKAGADPDVKDPAGKTAAAWAEERGYGDRFLKVLADADRKSGKSGRWMTKKIAYRLAGVIPFVLIPLVIGILSNFAFYIGIPLAFATIFVIQRFVLLELVLGRDAEIGRTPFVTAIPQATLLYVALTYLFRILPGTVMQLGTNLIFLMLYCIAVYSFYQSITMDPGYIRIPTKDIEIAQTVIQLAEDGLLDPRHFCTSCCIRKPVRSKHCRICNRCVAKFDHHCQWTYNCIGAVNHRQFMVFVISLILGCWVYVHLSFSYLENMAPQLPQSEICTLPRYMCNYLAYDTWSLLLGCWVGLNSLWVGFLLAVQSYQITRAITTNEMGNFYRYTYLIHPDDGELPPYRRRLQNPFDRGILANCRDFWFAESEQHNWFTTYEGTKTRIGFELV